MDIDLKQTVKGSQDVLKKKKNIFITGQINDLILTQKSMLSVTEGHMWD